MMNAAFYIHIPFCLKKCSYCDFFSVKQKSELINKFFQALKKEIEFYNEHPVFSKSIFNTIYFGGGTPSLLSKDELAEILQKVRQNYQVNDFCEITLEVNPETVTLEYFNNIRTVGINRLSIGVQSFSDDELKILGRIHNAEQARKSVQWAKQTGFDNISIDLIFAIPGQSILDLQYNLNQIFELDPQHISIYCLSYEQGTPLELKLKSKDISSIDEEVQREMYLKIINTLKQNGYHQYEISNFSKEGYESKHNSMYWDGSSYLGLGPSAHSFWPYLRQWNYASLDSYNQAIVENRKPVDNCEELSVKQQMFEFIMLHLRSIQGINIDNFNSRFGISFYQKFENAIDRLNQYQEDKLVDFDQESFKLTKHGFVLYDEICSYFVE